ncbi:membrane protein insertion efficiency factor YidD [Patescibacteria group bacterium]|nr:membrane protein insertion efficiency factor YidD [Patescibacteria group bacterium]
MKKLLLNLITFYQKYISPLEQPACRFYPTCSDYTSQSIQKYGIFKGSFLGFIRILKCNPFFKGGIDQVK